MDRRSFLLSTAAASLAAPAATSRKPNVIFILADDLGYGDLGCYGGPIRTPNLDSLARDGARFINFYSANPVCSPSRAAYLTGRYPTRVGVPRVLFPGAKDGLDLSETTLATLLKAQGYKTKCVGKWHLGDAPEYLPTRRGFDSYFGIPYSNDMIPPKVLRNTEVVEMQADQTTLTRRYTEEAVQFIEQSKDGPFFLFMPHTFPHIPLHASPKFRGKSPLGLYGDVVEELDWSAGEILKTLKTLGLESDTLVMFSSDNGPWYQGSPGKLRGRKGSTLEGGVRVPFLARMPGRIAKGRLVDGVASAMDLFPTIAKLSGSPLPSKPLDGIDIWPMLSGKAQSIDREVLLYFDNVNVQCARWRNWKLHIARYNSFVYSPVPAVGRNNLPLLKPELYDVVTDVDESYDVTDKHPDVVSEIKARIDKLISSFPPDIQKAYAATKALQPVQTPAGSLPREKSD
jgi:arylsulfatase A